MKKEETIAKYGVEAYKKRLEQTRQWDINHPDKMRIQHQKHCRKGGAYYLKHLRYQHTGLQGKRNTIRRKHSSRWQNYKQIIAPESQIHHQWRPGTADYDGVALVEKDQHRHGIIDVIQILDGEITVLTEAELKKGKMEN